MGISLILLTGGCEATRSAVKKPMPESPLKSRLAVVPVEGGGSLQSGLTELLTAELIQTGRFIVLERAGLSEVQTEQNRGNDPDFWKEGGVASRFIPARILLSIKTLNVGTEEDALVGTIVEGKGGGFRIKRAKVMLEVKLIDVGTAQVIHSKVVEASATGGDLAAGVGTKSAMVGTAMFNSSAVGRAAKEAIKKSVRIVSEHFSAARWETRIAGVRPAGKVYVAAGSTDGLRIGRQLEVHRPGEAVIDPSTGIQLAITEKQIGVLLIEELFENYSVGSVVSDTVPLRGDILRPNK